MTSREIVGQTLKGGAPRLARSFSGSDIYNSIHTARGQSSRWRRGAGGRWERRDLWGNLWARLDSASKGEVAVGALDDLSTVGELVLPDFSKPSVFALTRVIRTLFPHKWLIGHLPGFTFNVARKLRRMDQYLMDLVLDRERIRALHDRIDAALTDLIRGYARAGVDAVMFPEDWGTQRATFISPELWREEFFPRFQRLCSLAHEHGVKVFMHSCGNIGAIVPGLVEAGVDVLQFDQPLIHGLVQIADWQQTTGATFWCPVDIQEVLPTGDLSLIQSEARRMVEQLWKPAGGRFIAGFYSDWRGLSLDPRWQKWANGAFLGAS